MLVDTLPPGATLVVSHCRLYMDSPYHMLLYKAVFDACNSGTLLGKIFHEFFELWDI